MNCEEYAALLDRYLEGSATAEEEALIRRHEEECPACADQRHAMEALHQRLAELSDSAPPMPAETHDGWVTRIREDAMRSLSKDQVPAARQTKLRRWPRIVAAAAALVFLIGGTLLTRENMPRTTAVARSAASGTQTYAVNDTAGAGSAYMYKSANVSAPMAMEMEIAMDDVTEESADYDLAYGTAVRETKLIRSVSMTIATKQFDSSLEGIQALCADAGGYISWSSVSTASTGLRNASLTLRIPAEQLDAFLTGSAGTGRVTRRDESVSDVTDSYYDTKARLETQEALMARLQSLVTDAADLSDLLELERQIADTQYTIDSLKGSLQYTDQRVSYATVDIALREERDNEDLTNTSLTLGERIVSALRTGLETFIDFLADMAVFLVAALPFLAAVAVIVLVVVLITRHRRKKTTDNE